MEPQPHSLGLPDHLLCFGGNGFVEQLPPGANADSAATVEVDLARHGARNHSVYHLLRAAVFVRRHAYSLAMKVSVLSLGLLPLTFGYAIVRYRLMDVDLIFKRGMAYTLAAAAIAGGYFAVVAAIAELVHTRVPSAGPLGLMVAIMVTALLFDPVRSGFRRRWTSSSIARAMTTGARCRVWPRTQFGDRSRQDAFVAHRPAGAHPDGGSHCDFSRQWRLLAI